MLDVIKHITDDNFSFTKIAHRCIGWFSCFPVLTGSAEAQVIWGGIVKRLLIAYFIGNISARKHQNPFMCVKVIEIHRWDVFWDTVYITSIAYIACGDWQSSCARAHRRRRHLSNVSHGFIWQWQHRRHSAERIPPSRHIEIGGVSLMHGKCVTYLLKS